jgi:hypothetical protein
VNIQQGSGFCSSLWNCYLTTLGYGLREAAGVGDLFIVSVRRRWLLDLTFYFLITVGMLNLISGVIITTFGQLREDKARRLADTVGVCFICGIDKQIFDRASDKPEGFKTHVKIDHNMWNYLYFIFLLWEQDKDDDDGLEQYVRRAIANNDISWFPMNKAIRLRLAATKEENLFMNLVSKMNLSEYEIANKLDKIQTDVNIVLEQLNQALKQDHVSEQRLDSRTLKTRQSAITSGANTSSNNNNNGGGGMSHVNTLKVLKKFSDDYQQHDIVIQASMFRQYHRTLYVQVIELISAKIPIIVAKENVHVKIEFDDEIHIVNVEEIRSTRRATFSTDSQNMILQNAEPDDQRLVIFRIIFSDPVSHESEEVANVSSTVEELYVSEGSFVELYFDPPSTQTRSKLVILPTMQKIPTNSSDISSVKSK